MTKTTFAMFWLLSITVLVTSVPRFVSAFLWVPGDSLYTNINTASSAKDLLSLIGSAKESLNYHSSNGRVRSALGTAYLLQAHKENNPLERNKKAQLALDELTRSLEFRPLNPFTLMVVCWTHLTLTPQNSKKAQQYWLASIESARYEPFLFETRITAGLAFRNEMTTRDNIMMAEQVNWAYDIDRTLFLTMKMTIGDLHYLIELLRPWPSKSSWLKENRH